MAQTNFAALEDHKKKVWSRDVWHQAREKTFVSRFMGKSMNSMIYRITELTKSEKGTEAVIPLVPDLTEDGVAGDSQLEGNEEAMLTNQDKVQIDQLRHALKNTGRMADQATVIGFRSRTRDQLAYWLADRTDQMAFLTLSGVSYGLKNDGSVRKQNAAGNDLSALAFASDVSAPTSERHLRISGDIMDDGDTTAITADDKIGYKHIVLMQALAKTRYVRGIRGDGGDEVYHLFLHPLAMAALKLDEDFKQAAIQADVRGDGNRFWKGGSSYKVDGLMIHEFRHVFSTTGAASGDKWGAAGTIDGSRGLLCGAQALGFVDLGAGYWDEEDYDYGNSQGISYGKMFGMKKPKFKYAKASADTEVKQDYGVIAIDMAL